MSEWGEFMRHAQDNSPAADDRGRREAQLVDELLTLYRREGDSRAAQDKLRELRRLRRPNEPVH